MEKTALLLAGVLAWAAVAGIAVLVVNSWSDGNQVAAFFPIAAAVFVAWFIGEWVTARVFAPGEEGRYGDR